MKRFGGASDDLHKVVEHWGFADLSYWPEFDEPWAVAISFDKKEFRLTWFFARSLDRVLTAAKAGIEQFG